MLTPPVALSCRTRNLGFTRASNGNRAVSLSNSPFESATGSTSAGLREGMERPLEPQGTIVPRRALPACQIFVPHGAPALHVLPGFPF
jgi:hypothetical protein